MTSGLVVMTSGLVIMTSGLVVTIKVETKVITGLMVISVVRTSSRLVAMTSGGLVVMTSGGLVVVTSGGLVVITSGGLVVMTSGGLVVIIGIAGVEVITEVEPKVINGSVVISGVGTISVVNSVAGNTIVGVGSIVDTGVEVVMGTEDIMVETLLIGGRRVVVTIPIVAEGVGGISAAGRHPNKETPISEMAASWKLYSLEKHNGIFMLTLLSRK